MAYDNSEDETVPFESQLASGPQRFMAHVIVHGLEAGRRSSRDFLRHFTPARIMDALADKPNLRADILESATGVKRKIALKKSAASAGEDLQIALDEAVTVPDTVVSLFQPDDRVRYLPIQALWSYVVEGEFWRVSKADKDAFEVARSHVAFMLDRGLKDQLLSHQEVIEGIGVDQLAKLMPRTELEIALDSALTAGRSGQPFSDADLFAELGSETITHHIPLPHIWANVIEPCIAVDHELVTEQHAEARETRTAEVDTPAPEQEPAAGPTSAPAPPEEPGEVASEPDPTRARRVQLVAPTANPAPRQRSTGSHRKPAPPPMPPPRVSAAAPPRLPDSAKPEQSPMPEGMEEPDVEVTVG